MQAVRRKLTRHRITSQQRADGDADTPVLKTTFNRQSGHLRTGKGEELTDPETNGQHQQIENQQQRTKNKQVGR